jgi:hypothetical protein
MFYFILYLLPLIYSILTHFYLEGVVDKIRPGSSPGFGTNIELRWGIG